MKSIGYYNEAHGFLHDEFDKDCYCQGGCSMEAVYTESQVKKLTGENKVEKLQHQLMIPKSVADELEGFNPNEGETKIAVLIEGYNECFISDELMQFCLVDNNLNLCALYLAGKSLGVDLVKVVEG